MDSDSDDSLDFELEDEEDDISTASSEEGDEKPQGSQAGGKARRKSVRVGRRNSKFSKPSAPLSLIPPAKKKKQQPSWEEDEEETSAPASPVGRQGERRINPNAGKARPIRTDGEGLVTINSSDLTTMAPRPPPVCPPALGVALAAGARHRPVLLMNQVAVHQQQDEMVVGDLADADLDGAVVVAMSPSASPTSPTFKRSDTKKAVNGSLKLRKIIIELNEVLGQKIVADVDGGDERDVKMAMVAKNNLEQKIIDAKEAATHSILELGEVISCENAEVKGSLIKLVGQIFHQTDSRIGSGALMNAFARITSLGLSSMIQQRGWLVQCCVDGSSEFLETFLGLPEVVSSQLSPSPPSSAAPASPGRSSSSLQGKSTSNSEGASLLLMQALLQGVAKNATGHRAQLSCVIAEKVPTILGFQRHSDALARHWQHIFELVVVKPKTSQGASRRLETVHIMLAHPSAIQINLMRESSSDKQTPLSRAAREGDADLLETFALHACPNGRIDINKVSTDGSTALMQAVVANQTKAIKLLLRWPGIDLKLEHPVLGTVLEMAVRKGKTLDKAALTSIQRAYGIRKGRADEEELNDDAEWKEGGEENDGSQYGGASSSFGSGSSLPTVKTKPHPAAGARNDHTPLGVSASTEHRTPQRFSPSLSPNEPSLLFNEFPRNGGSGTRSPLGNHIQLPSIGKGNKADGQSSDVDGGSSARGNMFDSGDW